MKLNIVYKNEMKLLARSRRILPCAMTCHVLLSAILLLSLRYIRNQAVYSGQPAYSFMLPLFLGLMSVTAVLLALLMTPSAGASIAGERERQTLDILLSTRLTSLEIVTGKLLSSASSALLLLVSGLPVMTVTMMYGGIGPVQFGQLFLYLVFFIILAAGAGVMCSCLYKTVTSATVASYGILLFFTAGTGLLVVLTAFASESAGADTQLAGFLIYSWLLNPAVTFTGIVCQQLQLELYDAALPALGAGYTLSRFWIPASIAVQACALILMTAVSARRLRGK